MSARAQTTIESAQEGRRLMRAVLVALQESALAAADERGRAELLEVAARAAQATSELYSLEREAAEEALRTTRLANALAALRVVLNVLQRVALTNPRVEQVASDVAQVLGNLFTLSKTLAVTSSASRAVESSRSERQREPTPEADQCLAIPLTKPSRRATERVRIEVEVGLATESNFYAGLSLDISTGGLFVATYEIHPVGTQVTVTLVLPEGNLIAATGTVRWIREPKNADLTPGMGIEFAPLFPEDLVAIERFCRTRRPMYYDSE